MWWKVYFWIYLSLIIADIVAVFPRIEVFTFANWEGIAEGILLLLGTYSYIFKKHVFKPQVWKIIFWYMVIVWILGFIYAFGTDLGPLNILYGTNISVNLGAAFLAVVFVLPGLYAIYQLSQKKLSSKKK